MPDPKPKRTCGGNPNPNPSGRFQPGHKIRGGRVPLQRREGDNRHTVLDAAHDIAMMKAGEKLTEEQLKKKTRLWVMLYQMSTKDPKTFLGYYAGMPRQAMDLADVTPGSVAYRVIYDDDGLPGDDSPPPASDGKAKGGHKSSGKAKDSPGRKKVG